MALRDPRVEARAIVAELLRRRRELPLDYLRWLPGQWAFLHDDSKLKLFRAGNQAHGKTWAGLAETHFRCRGDHPFIDVPDGPIEAWIICASWSQSIAIQAKFWALTGQTGLLAEDTSFDPVKGFKGKNPAVQYKNGSIVRFKTTNQGGLSLAGATIDFALFDEPPKDQRIFGEVQKRVMRRAGTLALTLTPINAPCDWLKALVEKGVISEHHFRLDAKHLIPIGAKKPLTLADGTPMDAKWVEKIRRETLPREAPVILDGEWEVRDEGRTFKAFDHTTGGHVGPIVLKGTLKLAMGADHGDGTNFSQVAVLIAVDDSGKYPKIWVLDEYVSSGMTTTDMDAASITSMLKRSDMEWIELDHAHGDRKHGGRRSGLGKKSNRKLMQELADRQNIPYGDLKPRIRTVKRGQGQGAGSVSTGCNFLHQAMVRPGHFHVSPRCTRLIESLQKWDYRDTEWKHIIDALRYALHPWIFKRKTAKPTYTPVAA